MTKGIFAPERTNSKTIAKNTIYLYFRMMLTMIISLFTSRVILQALGIIDYGIYQSVGGIVGLLSFINGALSTGSSRFLTFELGTGDFRKLQRTFSTTLTIHITLAIMVAIVAETAGTWFIYNKLEIPAERLDAAIYVFHLSILTAVFTLTQVPYNATIIAHEKMSVYAYVGIVEVSLKLLIVYALSLGNTDKLRLYATLLFSVQAGLMIFYRIYCTRKFAETRYKFIFDKQIFKSIAGFSGWSLFANAFLALNSQGILILLNMFFSPAIVAARAISIQVNMAAVQFVSNFRTAANPQIVKRYALGDLNGSKRILLSSTRYSFYMMYIICLPIILLAYPILHLWLGIVPEYAVIFLQLIIIQSLFQVFDTSFYTALYAKGQLKENALISPTIGLISFSVIYVLFRLGYSPVTLSWANLFVYMLLGLIVKPLLIVKIAHYTWSDIWSVFRPCIIVTLISLPIPILLLYHLNVESNIFHAITVLVTTLIIVIGTIYNLGIEKETRNRIKKIILKRICVKQ